MIRKAFACLFILALVSVPLAAQELLGLNPQMGTQTQLLGIDLAAGAVAQSFGVVGGFPVRGMNAFAIEPFTGTLIGSTNAACDGTTGETWTIDKATGAASAPCLGALGGLAPGEDALFRLSNAPAGVAAVMVLSTMVNPTPFLGGFLAPVPAIVPGVFLTDANGNVDLTFLGGVFPGGTALSLQYVVFDPTATFQTSLSNAVVILFR